MDTAKRNITETLSDLCKRSGSNLTAVCTELRIQRPVLERWKYKTPVVIDNYISTLNKKTFLESYNKLPRALEIYLAIIEWCKNNTPSA